tara:strand:+ start:626 stop:1318 length:693 start_codon:yes stop_codon:yes gene_type:complete
MSLITRNLRRLSNTKQSSIEFEGKPSLSNMVDGQVAIEKKSNSQVALYKKKFGKLWKSYMSSNGNQYVDRTLTTNTLQYTNKFIDYRVFMHNFELDIGTGKIYMPWWGTAESSAMTDHRVGFVTPFKMKLHKIIIRPDNVIASHDVTIRVEKQEHNSNSVSVIATAVYDEGAAGTLTDDTNFELNSFDFDNIPVVNAGNLCGLSIQVDTDIVGSSHDWYVTSVWRVEVTI